MTVIPPPLPATTYAVYRHSAGYWHRESREFATEEQARSFKGGLPKDWKLEVREIRAEVTA